jgi:hypothetical protein
MFARDDQYGHQSGTMLEVLRKDAFEQREPLATLDTPGAFVLGDRLMTIDGTVEAVPDLRLMHAPLVA